MELIYIIKCIIIGAFLGTLIAVIVEINKYLKNK